jgi:hypothetical protein
MWRLVYLIAFCVLTALTVMIAPAESAAANPTPAGAGTPNLLIFELHLDRSTLADSLIV